MKTIKKIISSRKEYHRKWYLANKDKKTAQVKAYKLANAEKFKLYNKEYWEKNRERYNEWRRNHRKDPEKRERLRAQWREKEKTVARRLYSKNRQNKRRFLMKITDVTPLWLNNLFNKTTHCELCNCEMDNNGSKYPNGKQLDHITPLNVGGKHMKNNVRFICMKCNLERPKDGSDNLKLVEAQ